MYSAACILEGQLLLMVKCLLEERVLALYWTRKLLQYGGQLGKYGGQLRISRVIMATVKWTNKWRQRSGKTFVTFICAYAPTARGTPDVKCQFLEQLQVSLYNVPQDTLL